MRIFVTGSTGFIGKHLVRTLANKGFIVHALYRSENKIADIHHPNIHFFKGDITNTSSLKKAMKGCEYVFHLAAHAKVWSKQKKAFELINYQGTINVLEAALENQVKKVIFTSTVRVFGPSSGNQPVNESSIRNIPYFSEYERTKGQADKLIINKYATKIPVCIVCPTRVFGPGELSESNSVTRLIDLYIRGKFRFLPGNGRSVGNYVYVEDVINGMMLAFEKGRPGERYILGGTNISYREFFLIISGLTSKNYRMIKLPVFVIVGIAGIMKLMAIVFRIPPIITPGWARNYLCNWSVSSKKAIKELGYKPQPIEEGLSRTIVWLQKKNN